MDAYEDPNSPQNGPYYHTGKPCVEDDCDEPAGTAWSPYWCFKHNVERIKRVDASLQRMLDKLSDNGEERDVVR